MDGFSGNWLAWLVVGLAIGLFAIACGSPTWENDPAVEAARIACAGQRKAEHYACVEREAVASLSPDVCRLAGIGIHDACLQAVYEAADDPAICDRIYRAGAQADCRAWYAQRTVEPGALGERWQLLGEHLQECAPQTARHVTAFEEALATREGSFTYLCQGLGRPDWQTGSGLIIYIHKLQDGSEVRLGFGGMQALTYALLVTPQGRLVDLVGS